MKTFMESFFDELEREKIGTRKMLALVPADKSDFKPHEKSMSLKDLATHIADIPSWLTLAICKDGLDFATNPYQPKECNGGEELVNYYDLVCNEALENLKKHEDSILDKIWTMSQGEMILMQGSKYDTIRHSFGQMIHHRAQLGVYLRLLNIPIPGVYGPSADESY